MVIYNYMYHLNYLHVNTFNYNTSPDRTFQRVINLYPNPLPPAPPNLINEISEKDIVVFELIPFTSNSTDIIKSLWF